MENGFLYVPEGKRKDPLYFKCNVPMAGTQQQFLLDGHLEGNAPEKAFVKGKGNSCVLDLGKGEVMKDVLQLITLRKDASSLEASYSLDLNLDVNSFASVLLCSHTLEEDSFKTDETINVKVGDGAALELVLMQSECNAAMHTSRFNVDMGRDSRVNISLISLHGGNMENVMRVNLNGEGGECALNGLYLIDEEQRYSSDIVLRHNVPHCLSNQIFKGIIDDRSRARFSGLVYVAKDAQKTEAYQANHNLLVSDSAKIETEPHLEIYADDVKCSHGATTGRLDDEVLFYMRSRGIAHKEARILQQLAFVHEVLEKVSKEDLRERLLDLVERRLRGEFSGCSGCSGKCQ